MEDLQVHREYVQTGPEAVLQGQAKYTHKKHLFPKALEDVHPSDPLLITVPCIPQVQCEHPRGM